MCVCVKTYNANIISNTEGIPDPKPNHFSLGM